MPDAESPTILRVGLTGNIGAGKSTVGAMLAASGCMVIDADRLGHELLRTGSEAYLETKAAFGDTIVTRAGTIDRAALGRIVFADEDARARLNAIMHPRIRQLEDARIAAWPVERGIAITEAALLVETGAVDRYMRLVVVVAPARTRANRLRDRGMLAVDIRRRMAAQIPSANKQALADYVIDNGGGLDATSDAADALCTRLEEDLALLESGVSLPARVRRR